MRSSAVSPRIQLLAVAALGAAGAAWVGYQTAINPRAGPPHVAVGIRVAIVVVLIVSGVFAHLSRSQRSMGRLLIVAGLFSCVWLLNGSRDELIFSIGLVASGLAPGLFCYLMLAFPTGRIKSPLEWRFIITSTGVMVFVWSLAVLSHREPIISTPLLRGPQQGLNAFFLGLPDAHQALAVVLLADWLVMIAGTALLIVRRALGASPHFRRLLAPMVAVAAAQTVFISAFTISKLDHSTTTWFGTAYVATALAIPVAIFLGLVMQRLSLGQVLARFVIGLGTVPANDVQRAMASTLNDPQLRIYYRRGGSHRFVDSDGVPLSQVDDRDDRRQTWVEGAGRRPLAVVDFDASLSDQEPFIQAAGKSAVIWLDRERLAAELAASKRGLEASYARLAGTADEERRRIQRDLHDGAQQHLIAMHVKLQLALEMIEDDPARCASLLAQIGEEMGETATDLRSLASDVYPPTLSEYGLVDALRSAIRRLGINVRLEAHGIGRHAGAVDTQLYFVCLEALQNISKHGGPSASGTLRLWEVKRWLYFELRDSGVGFDPEAVAAGSGLLNMHDRLDSVGGRLRVSSSEGRGTSIRGVVPIRRPTQGAFEPPAAPVEAGTS